MVNYDKIFSFESEEINPEQSQEGLGIAFIMITSIALIGEIVTKIKEVHKKSVLKKNKKNNPDYNTIANDIKDFLQCISDNVVKTANVIKNNYDILLNNYCSNKDKLLKKVETVALDYFNNLDSIIVFSDINDNYNYKPDYSRVEQMAGNGALFDEFGKSIESDKRLKRVQNKDIWKFIGKKIEFEFYLNDYSFNDNQIGLHISLNEIDKSMSSESEDKNEEGTEVGVYACSQGVFDTNSKPIEIGGYQIDATKTDSSEQSEEKIDLNNIKYSTGEDRNGSNVTKEILNFIKKNKKKIINNFLMAVLEHYKNTEYGKFAIDDYGKDISSCTIEDMDKMIHKPVHVYADSRIASKFKSYFVIGAECILDPEHGIAVAFDNQCNVKDVNDHGYFL